MKKLYIFLLLFCTVLATYAKHDVAYICQGDTYSWNLSSYCTPDDTLIYASGPTDWNEFWQNTQYDTVIGNTIFLSPMADRVYKLISINGSDAMVDICPIYLTIYVRYAPTVSIDSIHHVTCPDGYLYPYADGSFHVNLDDSAQNYLWIILDSDCSDFYTHTYYDKFSIVDLRTGTYRVQAQGVNGCIYRDSVVIQQPEPWVDHIEDDIIDTIRCNEPAHVKLSLTGGTMPYTFNWKYDIDSTLIFPDTNELYFPYAGIYHAGFHDANGCFFNGLEEAFIIIYELVVDTIHIMPIDTIVCPGEEIMLSAYSRGFGNHTWSVGEYSDSINYYTGIYPGIGYVSDYFIDTLTQSQYIKVTFSDENGCETSDSIWVDVSHIEVVSNIPDYMCSDALYPVNLSSYTYGSPQGGSLSFEGQGVFWNGDFSPASSGLYTIYTNYTDLMGCIARDSTIVNVLDPDPIVLIIDTMICYGDIPTIQAQTLNYGSYVWHIGNVLDSVNYSLDIHGDSVVVTYQSTSMTQPTLISLDFANQHGCITHDSALVDIYNSEISLTIETAEITTDSTFTVHVSPPGGSLYIDDIFIAENIPETYTLSTTGFLVGEHILRYYGVFGGELDLQCEDEISIPFQIQSQPFVTSWDQEISIYPNPATTVLNLSSTEMMDFSISITDIAGKTIREERALSIQHALDVSGLSPGIYLLRMQTPSGASKSVKFVKR